MPEPKSPEQRRRPQKDFSEHDRTEVMAVPHAIRIAEGSDRPRRKVPEPGVTNVIPFVGRMPPAPRSSVPMPGVAPAAPAPAPAPAPRVEAPKLEMPRSTRAAASLPALPQAAPMAPIGAATATARKIEPPPPAPKIEPPKPEPEKKVPRASSSASLPAVFLPTPANSDQTIVTPPPPAVAEKQTEKSRWAVFEQLGLGPKKETKQKTAQMIVNIYRGLGFAVLSIIVCVLVAYIATAAFYFVSDSWIQPMVVSRSDERVLALEAQVAEQETIRDRILADIAQADRNIEVQQEFQAQFVEAVKLDMEGRVAELERVRKLAKGAAGTRKRIENSNAAYASESRRRMQREYAAGMIDRSDMLNGKFQLAQISGSNLSLAERQSEYETRAEVLEGEALALQNLLDENGGEQALSYEVLRIKQEYESSRLETLKALEDREALQAALERQESVLEGLRSSPYLRALADEAQVAFVPYENLDNVAPNTALYSCKLEMVFCHKVGRVIEVLPGEVNFKHPHREKVLRGQMVELDLDEDEAAEEDVLFLGGKPLLL